MLVLVINPGNTSSKVALWEDEMEKWREDIEYDESIKKFSKATEQIEFRLNSILQLLNHHRVEKLDCVIGRGGLFRPLKGGVYEVNEKMIQDIMSGNMKAEHISNIGAILAKRVGEKFKVKAYIVDPVSVDEFEDIARVSGIPEIEREALQHTLNIKRTARKAAQLLGIEFENSRFIVVHLGSGFSICPVKYGKIVDANNAIQEGPFSPDRAGGLPAYSLMELCFSGKYDKNWFEKKMVGGGGLYAYLGTSDLRKVFEMIDNGDKKAELIYKAMIYQIAKEIGAMATVFYGDFNAILLTGGLAKSDRVVKDISERVNFLGKILVFPGENEIEAMAEAGFRILKGKEEIKEY